MVRGAPLLRRVMPHVMPGRNESAIYLQDKIEIAGTLEYLSKRESVGGKATLFHAVLAAFVRTLAERPQLNRFVAGRRLYQRREISLSFAVKKKFSDAAPITTVKRVFDPRDRLSDVIRRVDESIGEGRGEGPTASEREMSAAAFFPRSALRGVFWMQRVLDYWNLLPAALIRNDPLYASAVAANLGSLGLPVPFHHLFEYGTVSLFLAVGKIEKAPVVDGSGGLAVREVLPVTFTFDDRICDGYYCARSLERFRELLMSPAQLDSSA